MSAHCPTRRVTPSPLKGEESRKLGNVGRSAEAGIYPGFAQGLPRVCSISEREMLGTLRFAQPTAVEPALRRGYACAPSRRLGKAARAQHRMLRCQPTFEECLR